jgi:hypothetical protein
VTERAADAPSLLRRISAFTWSERVLIVKAALLIAGLRLALRACGVRRVQDGLAASVPSSMSDATDTDRERATAMSRLVDVAARHTVRNTCLHRSLALWWLLGRCGVRSQIRIGTRRQQRRFEAHAWVEIGGVVINDRGEPGYQPVAWPPVEHEA